jgi:hypothetical protein
MEEHADRRPTPRKNVSMGSHRREKEVGLFGEDPGTQLRLRHSPCHRRWMTKKNKHQELPDPAHRAWKLPPGITPQHGIKPARSTITP